MLFEISYLIFWWLVILWLLPKVGLVKNLGFSSIQIQALFSLKVIVGISFMLFYLYYYGSRKTTDAFKFYDDANSIFAVIKTDPSTYFKIIFGLDLNSPKVSSVINQLDNWSKMNHNGVFNDNMTIIRFNALVRILSFDVYHIHTLIINLLGFMGLTAMVNAIKNYVLNSKLTFLSILLFPGIIFWSSGVLKEGLLIFVMGFLIYYGLKTITSFKGKNLSLFILFFLLGLMIKSYVAISLTIGFGLLITFKLIKQKSRIIIPVFIGLGISLLSILNFVLDLKIPERIYQKQHDFLAEIAFTKPGSAFEIFILEPKWTSLALNSPNAIFNALLRPFIWEAHSMISLIASFEILLLVSSTIVAFWFKAQLKTQQLQLIAVFSISAITILLIVGWVTPVFGALVRYKLPALILILIILNILVDSNKIPLLKKWSN